MKSVLMSIKPKYCELIALGKKTIEVRKTKPNLQLPFKCYIYCTKKFYKKGDGYFQGKCYGKVIGEFICDKVEPIVYVKNGYLHIEEAGTCLSGQELTDYYNGSKIYGWHISNLVIYDESKELYEFEKPCPYDEECVLCKYYRNGGIYTTPYCDWDEFELTRPPQSWRYVEETYA